jgi:hypothetical protein
MNGVGSTEPPGSGGPGFARAGAGRVWARLAAALVAASAGVAAVVVAILLLRDVLA